MIKSVILKYIMNIINLVKYRKEKLTSKEIYRILKKHYLNKEFEHQSYQKEKLSEIITYAFNHTKYWYETFARLNLDPHNLNDFYKLPLTDKAIIRKNTNKLISDNMHKLNYYKMNTGGSTGEPLEFYVSNLCGYIDAVHQRFLFEIMGYRLGDIIAAFDGVSVPKKLRDKNIFWLKTGENIPYGSIHYSSLYLNNKTIDLYIRDIVKRKPTILRGYPSFINTLAEYLLKNNISLDYQIKATQLTAENTFDWQINNIKNAFKTKVYFQYGHSEASVFAFTCDESYEYYCSPYYGFTEILNSKGEHVQKDEAGEVVVTSFYNHVMPFIRYKTGDIAIYGGTQKGFVVLKRIEGRTQDYIYASDGSKVSLIAVVFGQHYKAFRNIKKWQIIQSKRGEITITVLKDIGYTQNDENEIRKKFLNICRVKTNFIYTNNINVTQRGKFKFLVQKLS